MQNKSFGKNILQGIKMRVNKMFENPYQVVNLNVLKKIYYKHLTPGKIRTHKLFGNKFYFISPTELMHGFKEIFIEEVYKQNLPPNPYIIDCGANIGLSVIYLKQQFPDAVIIAFEPDEENFKLLKKNIESFGYKNVEARKEAVWIEDTFIRFAGEGSMSSRIEAGSSGSTIEVKAIRLRDLLSKTIDFLKIDIEGAEYRVIIDLADKLHFVKNLFLEYHGSFSQNNELTQIFKILVENGFSYYIKEATTVYKNPFIHSKDNSIPYDVQLNIFCFRRPEIN
jgi:FkbM family methyltransferase